MLANSCATALLKAGSVFTVVRVRPQSPNSARCSTSPSRRTRRAPHRPAGPGCGATAGAGIRRQAGLSRQQLSTAMAALPDEALLASMWRSLGHWRSLASMWRSPGVPVAAVVRSPARRSFRASWPVLRGGSGLGVDPVHGMHQILHGARIHHNLFPAPHHGPQCCPVTREPRGPRGQPGRLPGRAAPGQGAVALPLASPLRGISTPRGKAAPCGTAVPLAIGAPAGYRRTHGHRAGRDRPGGLQGQVKRSEICGHGLGHSIFCSVPSPTVHRHQEQRRSSNECEHELRCGVCQSRSLLARAERIALHRPPGAYSLHRDCPVYALTKHIFVDASP